MEKEKTPEKPEEKEIKTETKTEEKIEKGTEKQKKSEKKPEEKTKIQELNEKILELTELLQRTQANFENYRKQQEKRIQEIHKFANQALILQLLPLLDNFELALKNSPPSSDFLKGIELVYSQLFTILENQGLKPIPAENCLFDPYLHEALLKVPSDRPENTLLEELQKGFTLNSQVLRHAKVKVSSGKIIENKKVVSGKL